MDLSLPSSPCPYNEDTQESALKSLFREQSLFDHRPGMEHVCVGLCGSLLWQTIKQKMLVFGFVSHYKFSRYKQNPILIHQLH